MVRIESFLAWPEKIARARLENLRQKKRAFDKGYGVPLTPAEDNHVPIFVASLSPGSTSNPSR